MIKEVAIGVGIWLLFRKKKPAPAPQPQSVDTTSPLEMEAASAQAAAEQIRHDQAVSEAAAYAKIAPGEPGPVYEAAVVEAAPEDYSQMTARRTGKRSACLTADCTTDEAYLETFPSSM